MKKQPLFAVSLLAMLGCGSAAAEMATITRAALGDITQPGGARRFNGDQTDALKAALSDAGAKNVILLIGDGMGDSEITPARNYAMGAGGFFKGIDALPVTGQYTHYSLDKRRASRAMSPIPPLRPPPGPPASKRITARWVWM